MRTSVAVRIRWRDYLALIVFDPRKSGWSVCATGEPFSAGTSQAEEAHHDRITLCRSTDKINLIKLGPRYLLSAARRSSLQETLGVVGNKVEI